MTDRSAATDSERDAAELGSRLLEIVSGLADELHPHDGAGRIVTLDSSLDRDLGFDSLGRVELIVRVERTFDAALPEQILSTMETPRDLLRAVIGAGSAKLAFVPSEVRGPVPGEAEAAPPDVDTLTAALDWHATVHPERPHVRFYADEGEGEVITYRDLRQRAERLAGGLQQMDLKIGEAVVIMLPTSPEYFVSFFGVLLAGGIPVPIYPPMRPSQVADHLRRHTNIVANCRAGVFIVDARAKAIARLLKAQVDTLRVVTTPDELSAAAGSGPFTGPRRGGGQIALLQYTSGSTGTPKGVVLTHANLLANIHAMAQAMAGSSKDVFISWLPLYHDMGLIGAWLGTLVYGAVLVIMPPLAFLTRPQRWLWAIHRYRGTMSAAPNFAYEFCLRRIADADIEGLDLSSWRVTCNGAEQINPPTVERFCDRFGKYGFRRTAMMPAYGLAESSVGLAFTPLDRGPRIDRVRRDTFTRSGAAVPVEETDQNALSFVSCGRPLPGHDIRIVDAAGRELPERQEGRLQFRGRSATSGYFRNPSQTRRLFDGEWLNSDDLAYLAGGEVYVTGRTKDIIIRAGRNIYPDELEEAVGDLEGVQKGNVAVFASVDPASGTERLVVLAETRRREREAQEKLRARINELAVELLGTPPDDVVLAPPRTVLKTSSGKIRRAASREVYERGLIGKPHPPLWWQLARMALSGLVPQLWRAERTVAAAAYGLYGWLVFGLLAPPIGVAVALLPRSWRWRAAGGGSRLLARATCTPLAVRGLENLPPPERPCIFVSNHASYLDGFVLLATLPRQVSFVAKAELTKHWPARIPLRRIGAVFVERFAKQKSIEDARRVAETARAGRPPLFFAEGTFTGVPGLLPFHMGAFVAAADANTPVVPIAIRGTRSILRSGSWFPRRGAISVFVGKPIVVETLTPGTGADSWKLALELRDRARREILRYCGEPDLAHERPALWTGTPTGAGTTDED
ncbi:MAG: AMP-binding protein [Kiloniellales bacterium]